MERYFRFKTGTHVSLSKKEKKERGLHDYDERFKHEAANVLGVPVVNIIDFYLVFRNGVQHQAMPKKIITRDDDKNITGIYTYSIKAGYPWQPQREKKDGKEIHIFLDPWEFTKQMIDLFLAEPELLNEEFDHGLAEIYV